MWQQRKLKGLSVARVHPCAFLRAHEMPHSVNCRKEEFQIWQPKIWQQARTFVLCQRDDNEHNYETE